jgi:hypothetical protein
MANVYVGIAPLTIVRRSNGQAQSVYAGGPVPADTLQEDLDRFVAEGFIQQVGEDEVGGMQNDDPAKYDDPDGPGGVPARSASKVDWVAYAVSQGKSEEEANAATRDELAAEYVR